MGDSTLRSVDRLAGLDGLRGVAVIMVLVFHSGLGWLPGGFLGVSVFFTLSGYLITSLLLTELETSGRIDLRSFWSRRLRRLLPAALIAIIGVVVVAPLFTTAVEESRLRGDAVAGVLYVSNWRYIWSGLSYEELFATVSPLLHLWSLSIEAQMYLMVPVILGVGWATGLRRRGLGVVLGLGVVTSAVISLVLVDGDRLYYGTDARAAELLMGSVLACFWRPGTVNRSVRTFLDVLRRGLPLVLLAGVVATARLTTTSSDWVYSGGLAIFAGASALVVMGAADQGPARVVLSWPPLVGVGAVSYGLYLYHWPIFVWMSPQRMGFEGIGLFAIRILVTTAVTVLSYVVLEKPIRRRRLLPSSGTAVTVVMLVCAVVAPLVVLQGRQEAVETDQEVLSTVQPNESGDRQSMDEESLRIVVIGDSTAENMARALADVGDPTLGVIGAGVIGCPVLAVAEVFDRPDGSQDATYCPDTVQILIDNVERIDVVVVVGGVANQWDYRPVGGDEVVTVGSARYRRDLDLWMERVMEVLAGTGQPVLIFDAPQPRASEMVLGDEPQAVSAWNSVIAAFDEQWVSVGRLDYSQYLSDPDSAAGRAERPDGVHLERDFAATLARQELVPALKALHRSTLVDMDRTRCRVSLDDDRWRLDLERCRAAAFTSP